MSQSGPTITDVPKSTRALQPSGADAAVTSLDSTNVALVRPIKRPLDWRFAAVCVSHTAIDFLSAVVTPILSVLEGRLQLTLQQGAFLIALGSICSGLVQPLAAWFSDRFNTRLFAPLGLVVGVLSAASIAWVQSYAQLIVVQIILTSAIGAYHPVGASAMGQLAARRRSLGVAIFFTFGMIGSFSGSKLVPMINAAFGLRSFVWFILPVVAIAVILKVAIGSMSHRADNAQGRAAAFLVGDLSRRWKTVGVLYLSNMIRFTVNMSLVTLFVRLAEEVALTRAGAVELTESLRSTASLLNGNLQAAMPVGMAIGGLTAGAMATVTREKFILVGSAFVGAPAIALIPYANYEMTVVLSAVAGIGFAASIPVSISIAQRMLPHRTSLASGLMMGGAWTLAATGPMVSQYLSRAVGLNTAFVIVAATLGVAGAVSMLISSQFLKDTALAELA